MKTYLNTHLLIAIVITQILFYGELKSQNIRTFNSFNKDNVFQTKFLDIDTIHAIKNIGSYLAEFGSGTLMGGLVALPAGVIGAYIDKSGNHGEFAGLAGFLIGLSAGYIFGTAIGVHIVERSFYNSGAELWDALLGSVAGAAVGGLSLWQVNNVNGVAAAVILLACPVIGAILSLNTLGLENKYTKSVKINFFRFIMNNEQVQSIGIGIPIN